MQNDTIENEWDAEGVSQEEWLGQSGYHSLGPGPDHENTVGHGMLGDACPCKNELEHMSYVSLIAEAEEKLRVLRAMMETPATRYNIARPEAVALRLARIAIELAARAQARRAELEGR